MIPTSALQRAHSAIIKYFVWMSPIGLAIIVGSIGPSVDINKLSETPAVYVVAAAAFIAWIGSSLYFCLSLLVSKSLRETMLAKIAGVQEHDEREEFIVGRAARSTLLFSMAFLVGLFLLSTWRYGESVEHPKDFQSLTVGHFHLRDSAEDAAEKKNDERGIEHTVKLYDIPLSKSSLILLILFVQGLIYRCFAWRYAKQV